MWSRTEIYGQAGGFKLVTISKAVSFQPTIIIIMKIDNIDPRVNHRTKIGTVLAKLRQSKEEFLLVFTKKNMERRVMRCRFGVQHDLKGGINYTQQPRFPYQTVWDLDKKAYRTINMDTAISVIVEDGNEFLFQE